MVSCHFLGRFILFRHIVRFVANLIFHFIFIEILIKMKFNAIEVPKLIDESTGAYLYDTLRQCHYNRVITYSRVFNIVVVLVFVSIAIFVLYLCFYRKRSPSEEREKLLNDQKIILDKIRSLKEQKQNYYEEGSYTHLPFTEQELSHQVV